MKQCDYYSYVDGSRSIKTPKKSSDRKKGGFTIVELLVVIVVIGILAAITIVSYSGISQRATVASLQSDLDNNSKKLKMYYTLYNSYPTALNASNCPTAPTADNNYCLSASGSTTYQYTADSSNFCITATTSNTSYYINQGSSPASGGCPGDWVAGVSAITNLVTNPSFESTTTFFSTGAYAGNTTGLTHNDRDTTHVLSGSYAAMLESNNFTGQYYLNTSSAFTPVIGDTYSFSAYVYIPVGSTITGVVALIRDYSTWSNLSSWSVKSLVPGQWTRVSCSYTATSANPQWRLSISDPTGVTSGNPQYYWVDNVMITRTNSLTGYADGSYRNWTWSGTANSSTSSGPTY